MSANVQYILVGDVHGKPLPDDALRRVPIADFASVLLASPEPRQWTIDDAPEQPVADVRIRVPAARLE